MTHIYEKSTGKSSRRLASENGALQVWLDQLIDRLALEEEQFDLPAEPLTVDEVLIALNEIVPDLDAPWTADRLPPPPAELFPLPTETGRPESDPGAPGVDNPLVRLRRRLRLRRR